MTDAGARGELFRTARRARRAQRTGVTHMRRARRASPRRATPSTVKVAPVNRDAARHSKLVLDLERAERRLRRAFSHWDKLRAQVARAERKLERQLLAPRDTDWRELDGGGSPDEIAP